jgi:mycothiol synthase
VTDVQLGAWGRGVDAAHEPAVRALFQRVRTADGRGPGPDDLPGPDTQVLLGLRDGRPAGIAWRTGADPAELYVDPAHRRRGLGGRMARTLVESGAGVWAHGTLPAAVALAESLGLRADRTMLQLRRPLAGTVPVQPPDGVTIRTFVPGQDDEQFLSVNGRAFAWHPEQGRFDRDDLREAMAKDWFDPAGFFLATDDRGTLLGFHWTKVHPVDPTPPADRNGPIGEVYVLGVDPRSPVRGLGTPLTAAGLVYLAGRGLATVMLYVESDNAPALRLYRKFGFADYATDTVFAR